ncbi:hypothetical protein LIER_04710 [Lithospermum erythrorhizon]|uniref:Uncharacterized protein n=1 Tax=Lithospermum erythrorhizon TaxID=34254 RepID=A0AAV3NXP8_LITER
MHGKLNGGEQGIKKQSGIPTPNLVTKQDNHPKEEFSDWPNGLLAIGTFGNVNNPPGQNVEIHAHSTNSGCWSAVTKEIHERELQESDKIEQSSSTPDLTEFTQEEIGHLQKELKKLLTKKPEVDKINELPLDRFLNCPSSLEVDRRVSGRFSTNSNDMVDEEEIDRTIRVILGRCKDVRMENKNKSIGKKSISFLFKKMFVCSSGFAPTPTLRETFQESRMEKLLRTMLSKKINPQGSSSRMSTMKFIEDIQKSKAEKVEEKEDKPDDKSKWVKTDSECR